MSIYSYMRGFECASRRIGVDTVSLIKFAANGSAHSGSIVPSGRPLSGPLSDKSVYSDRGKFYDVTLPSGRKTKIYLRDQMGSAPNLAIPSEGWSIDEAKSLANLIYSSKLARKDGTVAGAPIDQTVREIISHDVMNRGWTDNAKNLRMYALAGLAGSRASNTAKRIANRWMPYLNPVMKMLGKPNIRKFRIEEKPEEVADIRAPESQRWLHKGIYDGILSENRSRRK